MQTKPENTQKNTGERQQEAGRVYAPEVFDLVRAILSGEDAPQVLPESLTPQKREQAEQAVDLLGIVFAKAEAELRTKIKARFDRKLAETRMKKEPSM